MKPNEKIYVKYFTCETYKDDFLKGEDPRMSSCWTNTDTMFKLHKGFDSIDDTLEAVCKHNCFRYNKQNWISFGKEYGEDLGRFDGCIQVNVDNMESDNAEIQLWKDGKLELWNCRITVLLEVRAEPRDLTAEELDNF